MGGYGSGGKNRRKDDITKYTRADSYDPAVRELVGAETEKVKAGIYDAVYFRCPECGRRVRYLYDNLAGKYVCRTCLNCNYPCQQLSRWRWAVVKVLEILKKLDVDTWNFADKRELMAFEPERPDYKMSEHRFFLYQMQLFKYRTMYFDEVCKTDSGKFLDGLQKRLERQIREAGKKQTEGQQEQSEDN